MAAIEEILVQRKRHGNVRAGMQRDMKVSLPCQRRCARIDNDQHRAGLAGFFDERYEVDARRRRIDTPQHDQLRVHVVFVGNARHLPVEPDVGGARCRRADRPRQARRAEGAPQRRVVRVLREQAVRAAVIERQDRLAARSIANLDHLVGDLIERLVPADAGEHAVALRPLRMAG